MERPELNLTKKDQLCFGDICLEMGTVLFASMATIFAFMMLTILFINLGF